MLCEAASEREEGIAETVLVVVAVVLVLEVTVTVLVMLGVRMEEVEVISV